MQPVVHITSKEGAAAGAYCCRTVTAATFASAAASPACLLAPVLAQVSALAAQLSQDVQERDERDEAQAHADDEHRTDLQARGVIGVKVKGPLPAARLLRCARCGRSAAPQAARGALGRNCSAHCCYVMRLSRPKLR